jgi:hypothetical protein
VSGLLSLAEIGFQIQQECRTVEIQNADVVIALTDGGLGLEDCLGDAVAGQRKQIEFILDFYHASERVHDFAKVFLPGEESARKTKAGDWCHVLKHQGGETLLRELESLDLVQARPEVVESHRLLTNYLRNNLHRTDYPRYVKNGGRSDRASSNPPAKAWWAVASKAPACAKDPTAPPPWANSEPSTKAPINSGTNTGEQASVEPTYF